MTVVDISSAVRSVAAFCTACKLEVLVDGSHMCPRCRQEVDPLSLPRVPEPHTLAVPAAREVEEEAEQPVALAVPERKTIRLPHRKSTVSLMDQAQRALDDLLEEQERLVGRQGALQAKRQALIAAAEAKVKDEAEQIARGLREVKRGITTLRELVDLVELRETPALTRTTVRPQLGPAHPGYAAPAPAKRWTRDHDQCKRCERSDRRHYGNGLCSACWVAWKKAGKPQDQES